jgi:hypothetical protein
MKVLIASNAETAHIFDDHTPEIKRQEPIIGGVLNPNVGKFFRTFQGDSLTREQVKSFNQSETDLCVIGMLDWEDDTGHYQTRLEQCLVKESSRRFLSHAGLNNNVEIMMH